MFFLLTNIIYLLPSVEQRESHLFICSTPSVEQMNKSHATLGVAGKLCKRFYLLDKILYNKYI